MYLFQVYIIMPFLVFYSIYVYTYNCITYNIKNKNILNYISLYNSKFCLIFDKFELGISKWFLYPPSASSNRDSTVFKWREMIRYIRKLNTFKYFMWYLFMGGHCEYRPLKIIFTSYYNQINSKIIIILRTYNSTSYRYLNNFKYIYSFMPRSIKLYSISIFYWCLKWW